jgi:hypothetical protein
MLDHYESHGNYMEIHGLLQCIQFQFICSHLVISKENYNKKMNAIYSFIYEYFVSCCFMTIIPDYDCIKMKIFFLEKYFVDLLEVSKHKDFY